MQQRERLPVAHTCSNTIDLPDYGSYAVLCQKFDQALWGDDGLFGLV